MNFPRKKKLLSLAKHKNKRHQTPHFLKLRCNVSASVTAEASFGRGNSSLHGGSSKVYVKDGKLKIDPSRFVCVFVGGGFDVRQFIGDEGTFSRISGKSIWVIGGESVKIFRFSDIP